ncbi:sortase family protein [Euzebya pacifica]|uniref:Sortase family protein n=1 Tax=Euzebya pacifica TaxID=1608957 RepID=A0A346XR78_9ACTN|nr:sortase family protein [Euzebya pacifica]
MRSLGWLFIAGGAVLALYLVYSLYWTGIATSRAQEQFLDDWVLEVGELDDGGDPLLPVETEQPLSAVEVGEAVAALQFHRPGSAEQPVYEGPLFIVEGVNAESLSEGPGHYPGTAYPGEQGNFAVAGHRTTAGAPFYDLETLETGDEIHVTDRNGVRWVYEVVEQRIVDPSENYVLGQDPIGTGAPVLTLTTCHPRWSNRERLIVFAELAADQQQTASAPSTVTTAS